MVDAVLDGSFEAGHQLSDDGIFVRWIHRVCTSDHDNEVHFQLQRPEPGHKRFNIAGVGGSKERDLHATWAHCGGLTNCFHLRHDQQFALRVAGKLAMFIGDKASDEFDVGGDNAELDVRFKRETCAHALS